MPDFRTPPTVRRSRHTILSTLRTPQLIDMCLELGVPFSPGNKNQTVWTLIDFWDAMDRIDSPVLTDLVLKLIRRNLTMAVTLER